MIAGSLFPTDTTINATIRGNTYTNEFTKKLSQLGLTDFSTVNGDTNAYFLGWINPYNLPDTLKSVAMAVTGTGDNTAVEFVRPNYTSNIPFGYMYDVISDGSDGRTLLWKENGGTFNTLFSSNDRLINKFYPEWFSVYPPNIAIELIAVTYDPVGNHVRHFAQQGEVLTYDKFKAFEAGNYTIHFKPSTLYTGGFECDFQVTGTDFTTGVCSKFDSEGSGYQATIFFSFRRITKFASGTSTGSNHAIIPMIHQTMEFNFSDSSQDITIEETRATNGSMQAFSQFARISYDSVGITGIYPTTYSALCWHGCPYANVTVPQDIIIDRYAYVYYQNGIIVSQDDLNNNKYVRLYHRIDEVEKFLNLFPRPSAAASISYVEGLNYATDVSSNDEFLDEKKTGSIYDENFRNSLRDWQYIPLNDDGTDEGTGKNDFDPDDPEDMPPYDPTPPEPTPGTDIPDDENPEPLNPGEKGDEGNVEKNTVTPNGVSAFTTSYIMTELEVSSLGNRLWTSVQAEPSAQRNFFTIKDDTANYELTNSNIIDYLVSLKWYPFSITSYCNFSTWSAYLIGSGTYAYTGSAYVAEDAVGYIPGGHVDIPWSTNTFVDLEPYTSVSFFIPFCGTVDIPASKVRGRRVTLDYYVDYITGGCTAYLTVPTANGSFPVASINGTLGFDMLVTGNNAQVIAARAYQQNNERRLREIEGLGGAIIDAVGGLVSNAQSGGGSKSGSSRDFGSVGGITSLVKSIGSAAFSEIQGKLSQGTLQGTSPLTLGSSSTLSSLGYLRPFAAVTSRVFFNNGTGYDKVGYISNKPLTISNIKDGVFFNCINPELKSIGATNSELAQITSMLSSGVYK